MTLNACGCICTCTYKSSRSMTSFPLMFGCAFTATYILIFRFFIYIRLFILSASRNKFKPVCQKVIVCADPVLHLKPTFHVKPTSHVKPMFAPHTKLVFEVKFHPTTKMSSLSCSGNLSCQRHGTCHVTRVF